MHIPKFRLSLVHLDPWWCRSSELLLLPPVYDVQPLPDDAERGCIHNAVSSEPSAAAAAAASATSSSSAAAEPALAFTPVAAAKTAFAAASSTATCAI